MLNSARATVRSGTVLALLALLVVPVATAETGSGDYADMSWDLRQQIAIAVNQELSRYRKSVNDQGIHDRRGVYSRDFKKVDENTYLVTVHVHTAEETRMVTERILLTVQRESERDETWDVTNSDVQDNYSLLVRGRGFKCYPFEKFSFDREGLELSARDGWFCEGFRDGDIPLFALGADKISYDYAPPDHADPMYKAVYAIGKKEHAKDVVFKPQYFTFNCDPETCEELIDSSFTGLTRVSREERSSDSRTIPPGIDPGLEAYVRREIVKAEEKREKSAFADFEFPQIGDQRTWTASVYKDENHALGVTYNTWGGYEVSFWVARATSDTEAVVGQVFGYYTRETYEKYTPYELEQRDDFQSRFYDVYKLTGLVEAGLEDPEMIEANLEVGLTLKEDMRIVPFAIINVYGLSGAAPPRSLFMNSIQLDGEELTWFMADAVTGAVVLPEEHPAGSRLDLRLDFSVQAMEKVNHAYSRMSRFGWMPFITPGEFIDNYELTIKSPAEYTILAAGTKTLEERDGDVLVTHWVSESPVVFPTLIFGKYTSDSADFDATKSDGTVVPVVAHVDEVSMGQLGGSRLQYREQAAAYSAGARGIRGKQLKVIAGQAANAINLYNEISGVDYPYGELNLVNDPAPIMYGQAPSALIYLGSMVFRGEGEMATSGGGTGTAKFLKSVVAHEVAHQWWGSRITNSNQRNYWFIESLAEYFSAIYLEAVYGEKEYQEQVDEWRRDILNANMMASVQNASTHWAGSNGAAGTFPSYRAAVYAKGPYMFHILRETFGDDKFFQYLKAFSMELAEKGTIVSRDIQMASEKHLGGVDAEGNPYNVELEWFFDQWLRGVGLPQYKVDYDVRRAESGDWIIEGSVKQRVVIGNNRNYDIVDGQQFRGVVYITAVTKKGQEFKSRIIVQGAETPFRVTVPEKPLEVALNKYGEILAHDAKLNVAW